MSCITSRQAMVDAAERIVAERGLRALTFTAVQHAAGQSNKSAVVYHFGSQEGLVEAVVTARMEPISQRRQVLLDQLEQSTERLTIRRAVSVLVEPLVEETVNRPGSHFARFLAQAVLDPELGGLVHKHVTESFRRVHHLLTELSLTEVESSTFRTDSVVLFTWISLASHEGKVEPAAVPRPFSEELIDMLAAMLSAPATPIAHGA